MTVQEGRLNNLPTMKAVSVVAKIQMSESEIAFDDLAVKTSSIALHWLKAMIKLDIKPVQDLWCQIPGELVSDSVRSVAVMADAQMFKHMQPKDTEQYLRLFLTAYKKDASVVKLLHADYRTASTVVSMMWGEHFPQAYRQNPWIAEISPPELIERAAMASVDTLVCLPREQISQRILSVHLLSGFKGFSRLRSRGCLRLAADYLKAGQWPRADDSYEVDEPPPSNAQAAFKRILEVNEHGAQSLLMAYLLNQPIKEVVGLMNTREHVKLAIEMYTEDELRPLLKKNRYLKEALLEDSLGL